MSHRAPTLTKPPKDQTESYTTPPSGTLFKGTKPDQTFPRAFRPMRPHTARQHDIPGKGAK